jgi:hypothetical protein
VPLVPLVPLVGCAALWCRASWHLRNSLLHHRYWARMRRRFRHGVVCALYVTAATRAFPRLPFVCVAARLFTACALFVWACVEQDERRDAMWRARGWRWNGTAAVAE